MNLPHPESEHELYDLLQAAFEAHQDDETEKAEALYRHLLTIAPDLWQLYYNLGLLLYDQNRFDEALLVYEQGLAIRPDDRDLLFNYAICQKDAGFLEAALSSYDKALAADPENPEIHYNRAGCLAALQRHDEAFWGYEDALLRNPDYLSALINQAFTCHLLGETEKAVERYRNVLELDPHNTAADHMLAALTGSTRTAAPESYIEDVFDDFSGHYEKKLVDTLEYCVPDELYKQVMASSGDRHFAALLDLGCGTGLIGQRFAPIATEMHGVDLSGKMLEQARGKNVYSALYHSSIDAYLHECRPDTYDLVIAADVFNYIGELDETFSALHRVSRSDVFFFFTVEELADKDGNMRLETSGRFTHTNEYIIAAAKNGRWQIFLAHKLNLRREKGEWVKGLLYGLNKHGN